MAPTFYHVDRKGNLQPGDVMDLGWPAKLSDTIVADPPPNIVRELQTQFPDGLSSHGAKYATAAIVSAGSHNNYDQTVSKRHIKDTNTGHQDIQWEDSYNFQYEFAFELYRQAHFDQKQSRFQTYFGTTTAKDARKFQSHRSKNSNIVKISCDSYETRDMEFVKYEYFADIFTNGEEYWSGKSSIDPFWEVAMIPPVTVERII